MCWGGGKDIPAACEQNISAKKSTGRPNCRFHGGRILSRSKPWVCVLGKGPRCAVSLEMSKQGADLLNSVYYKQPMLLKAACLVPGKQPPLDITDRNKTSSKTDWLMKTVV